jgi:hypothetical protein
MLQEELLTLLRSLDRDQARQVVAALSPMQKEALRQAIQH